MRRNGFSASSRHAPPGGTMGDTAGGDGRRGDWQYEKRGDRHQAIVPCHIWWTRRDSNPRPSACKAAAPATELLARIDIYNIPIRKWKRNFESASPSYLHNSSDGTKQAGDFLPPPRSTFRHRSPSKLIVECAARRFTGRRGEEAGGER